MRSAILKHCAGFCLAGMFFLTSNSSAEDSRRTADRLLQNYREMTARNILVSPIPKRISFYGEPIRLEQMALLLQGKTEYGDIAVEEINSRIVELGGEKLAVSVEKEPGKFNLLIDTVFLSEQLKPEGYCLLREKDGLRLGGVDRSGLLYAAVTARGLFSKEQRGIIFHAAEVTDWPDIPLRQANAAERTFYRELERNDPERYLQASMPWMKQLFRHKINSAGSNTWTPYLDCFSPFREEPDVPEQFLQRIRELNDYMRTLGITQNVIVSTKLGTLKQNSGHPKTKDLMLVPYHDYYFSWGYPDLQKTAAEKLLAYAKSAGIAHVWLHPVDSGGIFDPENWSNRDPASRELYPLDTDRARADADQFAIYSNVFADSGITVGLVPYPYSPSVATRKGVAGTLQIKQDSPLVDEYLQRTLQWSHDLHKHLPLDVPFVVREDDQAAIHEYAKMFPGRRFSFYFETNVFRFQLDDHPVLSPYLAAVKTFAPYTYHVHREHSAEYYEPFIPITAEYLWNVHAPHHTDYQRKLAVDPGRLPFMSEYTCSATWGLEIGRIIAPAFASGLSLKYLVDPEEVELARNIKEPLPAYERGCELLLTAVKSFDLAQEKLDEVGGFKHYAVYSPAAEAFNQYRLILYGTRIHAAARLAKLRMLKAVKDGKLMEVSSLANEATAALRANKAEFDQLRQKLKDNELLLPPEKLTRIAHVFEKALFPDVDKLIGEISAFDAEKQKLFASFSIPEWLKKSFQQALPFHQANSAITLDGVADEPAWQSVPPLEHFVGWAAFKLAGFPISVRILYDEKYLYVSGKAERAGLQNYSANKIVGGESFQLFFIAKDGSIYQQIIFPGGKFLTHTGSFLPGSEKANIFTGESAAQSKTQVTPDHWSFETMIPHAELGGLPSQALFAYEMAVQKGERQQYYASSFADGGSFFDKKIYRKLESMKFAPQPESCLSIHLAEAPEMSDVLHASGTGTRLIFQTEIESLRPLKNLTVNAEILNLEGMTVGKAAVAELAYLSARHTPEKVAVLTDTVHGALIIVMTGEFTLDGQAHRKKMYFPAGQVRAESFKKLFPLEDDIFFHAYYPQRMILKEGSVELDFLVKKQMRSTRTLFHASSVNHRHPAIANNNSIQARIFGNNLDLEIWDRHYKRRRLSTRIQPGKWHNARFEWKFEQELVSVNIVLDGNQISIPESSPQNEQPFSADFTEAEFVQFNALNTGYAPSYGVSLKNISVNDRPITEKDLYFGSGATGNNVFPAAVSYQQCPEK